MEDIFRRQSYHSIKKNRVLRHSYATEASRKLFKSESKECSDYRNEIKEFVKRIPQQEEVIEDCIVELKIKLKELKQEVEKKEYIKMKHHTETCSERKRINIKDDYKEKKNAEQTFLKVPKETFARNKSETKYRTNTEMNRSPNKYKHSNRYQGQLGKESSLLQNKINRSKIVNFQQQINIFSDIPVKLMSNHEEKNSLKESEIIMKNTEIYKQEDKEDKTKEKIGDLSTIEQKKETINFLGESCRDIPKEITASEQKTLNFINWKTEVLKEVFTNKSKKRKYEFDKMQKIFPKGFFQ